SLRKNIFLIIEAPGLLLRSADKMRRSIICLAAASLFAAGTEYRQAVPGYRYQFPRDHFNHPEFRTEWWYYTGNVHAADGHRFGFELTFFRQAMQPKLPEISNVWDVRDVWMAHLALSDISRGRFHNTERLNRS